MTNKDTALADRIDAAIEWWDEEYADPDGDHDIPHVHTLLDAARKLSLVLRSGLLDEDKRFTHSSYLCSSRGGACEAVLENRLRAKVLEIIGGVG